MTLFVQNIINGLTVGAGYALLAIGFSILYSTGKVMNFAHGEIYMLGAFASYYVISGLGSASPIMPVAFVLILAALASCVVGAVFGVVTERFVFRPLRSSTSMIGVMSSLGLAIVLENLALWRFGADNFVSPRLWPLNGFHIFGAVATFAQTGIILGTGLLALALDLLVRRHPYGKITRAVAADYDTARLMGISVDRVLSVAFAVAAALGGLAGFVTVFYYGNLSFNIGFSAAISGFAAAVLGGFGNLRGAVLGGVVLGLGYAFAGAYSTTWAPIFPMLVLLIAMIVRPTGLLGSTAGT